MKTIELPIGKLRPNEDNPRYIKEDKFNKLVNSIKEFPEMLAIRPIVVNEDYMILGGNMRYKACIEAGIKKLPVIVADNLTAMQQNEFIIKDNVSGGDWDWDILANSWEAESLTEWGLDLPTFEYNQDEMDDFFNVADQEEDDPETHTIVLKYNLEEGKEVEEHLKHISSTLEDAVWKLIKQS